MHRPGCISLVAFEVISQRQRLDRRLQLIEAVMIGDLVNFRVALAVATNIRQAVRRFWIGPEIRRLAHVVMLVSAWRYCFFIDDRKRAGRKCFLCFPLEFDPSRRELLVIVFDEPSG